MFKAEKGFTLIELMIVIAIIAIIAAIAIPGLLQSQRASNERSASASLKTVASAEMDFRVNDRDANKVNDFWTYNLKGLYTNLPYNFGAAPGPANAHQAVKLIELSLAGADAGPTVGFDGTNCHPIQTFAVPSAKAGYWYQRLSFDSSTTPIEPYLRVSGVDNAGVPLVDANRNTSKFGFVAYPDHPSAGRCAYILNEANTILRRPLTANVRLTPAAYIPAGTILGDWPNDTVLKASWSKVD